MAGEYPGPKRPYEDAVRAEIPGRVVFTHSTAASIIQALGQERPQGRIFTFSRPSEASGTQRVAFVDVQGSVHMFATEFQTDEAAQQVHGDIRRAIVEHGHRETDGKIKVNAHTGDVYQVYETDRPENPASIDEQVQAWKDDVTAASSVSPGGRIQYLSLSSSNSTLVDFTHGKNHLVTELPHAKGHTLESATSELPDMPRHDNTPFIHVHEWFRMIESSSDI